MTRLIQIAVCEVCDSEFRIWNKNDASRFCSMDCYGISKRGKPSPNKGKSWRKARKLNNYERGWLTALIDGEGSVFNSRRSTGGFNPRIQVGMTNYEILERLCEVTGVGTVTTASKPRKKNHAQGYYWRCDGANATSLLDQCLDGLIVKRERAIEMISTYTFTLDPA